MCVNKGFKKCIFYTMFCVKITQYRRLFWKKKNWLKNFIKILQCHLKVRGWNIEGHLIILLRCTNKIKK